MEGSILCNFQYLLKNIYVLDTNTAASYKKFSVIIGPVNDSFFIIIG